LFETAELVAEHSRDAPYKRETGNTKKVFPWRAWSVKTIHGAMRRGYIKRWKIEKAFKLRKLDNEAHPLEKWGWRGGWRATYEIIPYTILAP
jgi:hypothetical protein